MNGQIVPPLYVIRHNGSREAAYLTGSPFGTHATYLAGSPFMVAPRSAVTLVRDPRDAVPLELADAARVRDQLRGAGSAVDVVAVAHALRDYRAQRVARAAVVASVIAALAIALAVVARHALASYRVVIDSPAQVCTVPDGGIEIDTPHLAGRIGGVCVPDVIFRNGFQS